MLSLSGFSDRRHRTGEMTIELRCFTLPRCTGRPGQLAHPPGRPRIHSEKRLKRSSLRLPSLRLSAVGIENQFSVLDPDPAVRVEVKQILDRSGDGVEGLIADLAELPVVFDEAENRSLIGHGVGDEVFLCEGRNHEKWKPGAVAAAVE